MKIDDVVLLLAGLSPPSTDPARFQSGETCRSSIPAPSAGIEGQVSIAFDSISKHLM